MKAAPFETRTQVHSLSAELTQRQEADRRCLRAELRLYCFVTCISEGLSSLLAETGAAAIWLGPLCLLPGLLLLGLGALCKRLTAAPTLTEAFRAGLHPALARVWQGYGFLLLCWQGESLLTDMVCLFTEGVVTNVEPFWMALVTLLAALCCCQEKGLPRCVWLLRFPLLVLALLLLADLLTKAQLDFLHPISGAGDAVNQRLFLSQNALGWPLLLFAELPPGARRRETGPLPPLVLFLLMLSAAVLALPTELAMTAKNLADAMLLPLVFLTPTNRLLALVGWMVGLLLALAISLRRGTSLLRALGKPHHARPFYAGLAVLLLAPQIAGTQTLRHILKLLQPWLLAPGAALLLALVPGAILCQRRRSA